MLKITNSAGMITMVIMLAVQCALSQRHDYNWLFHSPYSDSINLMSFNNLTIQNSSIYTTNNYFVSTSNVTMSDDLGNLQFATNGCFIIGPDLQIMENGERLNPNAYYPRWCPDYGYFNGHQSCIALPDPANENRYYLFHTSKYLNSDSGGVHALQYSLIDMEANGGLGTVLEKNVPLIADSSLYGTTLTAVKHENGKDWWIINPLLYETSYVRFLLDSNGVSEPMYQRDIGRYWLVYYTYGGVAQFTPDGKKYIRWNAYDGTHIYDFDRATGLLSNPKWYDNRIDTNFLVYAGMAVSPNSRFLYLSSIVDLYQYDLEADDFLGSAVHIGSWDPELVRPTPNIWAGQLGPDCRIYFTSTSSSRRIHVIHNPDAKGIDCDFRYYSLGNRTGSYNIDGGSLPHYPNYRLDSEPVCDPGIVLTGNRTVIQPQAPFSVFPNPVHEQATLRYDGVTEATMSLMDISGRELMQQRIVPGDNIIHTEDLQGGVYILTLYNNRGLIGTHKLVK